MATEEEIQDSMEATIGADVSPYVSADPAPKGFGNHVWPWDDPEAKRLGLTPSQHSRRLRSRFAAKLPTGLSPDEMHDAWHRFLVDHPGIWPACHGALADRVEEARFFLEFES